MIRLNFQLKSRDLVIKITIIWNTISWCLHFLTYLYTYFNYISTYLSYNSSVSFFHFCKSPGTVAWRNRVNDRYAPYRPTHNNHKYYLGMVYCLLDNFAPPPKKMNTKQPWKKNLFFSLLQKCFIHVSSSSSNWCGWFWHIDHKGKITLCSFRKYIILKFRIWNSWGINSAG